jgi:DNA processing protein
LGRIIMKGTSHQVVDTIRSNAGSELDADTVARVAWASITDPGNVEVGRLIEQRGAVAALEAALDPEIESIEGVSLGRLRSGLGPRTTIRVAESLAAAMEHGWMVVTPLSRAWPAQCDVLGDRAPACLWVAGDPSLLTRATLALTGARSPAAERVCNSLDIATALAGKGWVLTGGANPGIETCAHRAGLAMHAGTIAVLPCGIDQVHDAGRESLLMDIERGGAVLSEFAPGTVPNSSRQALRNQFVAALSAKTVVVDAEVDSAATVIGEEARKLGRPVGVVAAASTVAESSGCRQLRCWFGARPVSSVVDIDRL